MAATYDYTLSIWISIKKSCIAPICVFSYVYVFTVYMTSAFHKCAHVRGQSID